MARTAYAGTSAARFGKSAKRTPILPPAFRSFIHRRLIDLGALCLIALAVVLAISFATYNHADPSFDHATRSDPTNLAGRPGAYAADLFLFTLGLAPDAPPRQPPGSSPLVRCLTC